MRGFFFSGCVGLRVLWLLSDFLCLSLSRTVISSIKKNSELDGLSPLFRWWLRSYLFLFFFFQRILPTPAVPSCDYIFSKTIMYLSSASIILGALLCCSPLRMHANAAAMPHPNPQTFHHCLDPRKFYQFCCETIMEYVFSYILSFSPFPTPPFFFLVNK